MVSEVMKLLLKHDFQLTLAILKPDICGIPVLCNVKER